MTPRTPPQTPPESRPALDVVWRVLRAVLGDGPPLAPGTPLFDLDGFDSLALAAVVEALEAELGVDLPDELLVPETFTTPDDIAGTVVVPALRGDLT